MPRVPLALLADHAAANELGAARLHVIGGGIRSLSFGAFPATRTRLALALGLEFTSDEAKSPEHSLQIEAKAPDGRPILKPLTASFVVRPDPDQPAEPIYLHFVYNMENITFPIDGAYSFSIVVDGSEPVEVPLQVLEAPGRTSRMSAAVAKLSVGYEAFSRSDLTTAQQNFQEVVADLPEFAHGHNNLGFVLLAQGQAGAALASFSRARQLGFPQAELLDANLACCYYVVGDAGVASLLFQQCLATYGFGGRAFLFGINDSGLFPVHLVSAFDYASLMMLNAAWSALKADDRSSAGRFLEGAQASDLSRRDDESGRNFAAAVEALKQQLAQSETS